MSQEVEVSLRVPNMKARALDEQGLPIDHSAVRFKKVIVVPAIPKPGDVAPDYHGFRPSARVDGGESRLE